MEKLTPELLKRSLDGGWRYLELNSKVLDNLNVFPVPDGDTGINMVSTLRRGIENAIDPEVTSIAEVSRRLTDSFSENSRGNSGFILAQFFAGFFEMVSELDHINAVDFMSGFSNGSYRARTALLTPVEGTMITIMTAMVEELDRTESNNIIECFDRALAAARKKIHETPALLPVLAKAGVVDSGALGFLFFVEGMLRGITRKSPITEVEDDYRFEPDPNVVSSVDEYDHRYCTEFTVELGPTEDGAATTTFRETLPERGSSIALVQTETELRLHIHTNEPEKIERDIASLGTVVRRKVEDMLDQVSAVRVSAESPDPSGTTSVLAIVPGEGFDGIFRDLGAANTLLYECTLPSSGEIGEALEGMDSGGVIILPNNKNIIPAAMLAVDSTDLHAVVLPTNDIVQGLSAMYAFLDEQPLQLNYEQMHEDMTDGMYARLFISERDTTFGDANLKSGEYFAVIGDNVVATGPVATDVVADMLDSVDLSDKGSITLFHGTDDGEGVADTTIEELSGRYSPIEFESVSGGQKSTVLIIAVE